MKYLSGKPFTLPVSNGKKTQEQYEKAVGVPLNTTTNLEVRARRFAKKHGYRATKSQWLKDTVDNYGQFQLIEIATNTVVGGLRFDMSAEEVVEFIVRLELIMNAKKLAAHWEQRV